MSFNKFFNYLSMFSFKYASVMGIISFFLALTAPGTHNYGTGLLFGIFVFPLFHFAPLIFGSIFFILLIIDLFFPHKEFIPKKDEPILNTFYILFATFFYLFFLWNIGLNIFIYLFIISILFLLKAIIRKQINKKELLIRCLLIFFLYCFSAINDVEKIGSWKKISVEHKKYFSYNKMELLPNGNALLMEATSMAIYDVIKNSVQPINIDLEGTSISSSVRLNNGNIYLLCYKKNKKNKRVYVAKLLDTKTMQIKDLNVPPTQFDGVEYVLLKNSNVLCFPKYASRGNNFYIYNPEEDKYTKNTIPLPKYTLKEVFTLSTGDVVFYYPSKGLYLYNIDSNTLDLILKTSHITQGDITLLDDNTILNINSGFLYDLKTATKTPIKNKLLNVYKRSPYENLPLIKLKNGNVLIPALLKKHKIKFLNKYNPYLGVTMQIEVNSYLYDKNTNKFIKIKKDLYSSSQYATPRGYIELENGNILLVNNHPRKMLLYKIE